MYTCKVVMVYIGLWLGLQISAKKVSHSTWEHALVLQVLKV